MPEPTAPSYSAAGAGRSLQLKFAPDLARRIWPALLVLAAGLVATAVATRHTDAGHLRRPPLDATLHPK
jgi:hypothetical protein